MSVPAIRPMGKRIRWKAGKEDELWNYVQSHVASGVSISEALKTFADSNGISWLTARWKYYRLKQDRTTAIRELEEAPEKAETPAYTKPDAAFEALSAFLQSASRLEQTDLTGLLMGLASMAKSALGGEDAERTAAAIRQQYNELQVKMQEYDKRFQQVRQEYETLACLVDEWLNLHSVDRVTSMGDFAKKLRVQVDQFNRVLAIAENLAGRPPRVGLLADETEA